MISKERDAMRKGDGRKEIGEDTGKDHNFLYSTVANIV